MRRREFITLLGGAAAAWPLAARAQQQAQRVPVIGFLHPGFSDFGSPVFDALREGLREGGYVEGDNMKLEARWARDRPELLPQLTQELIQLRPAILVATARPSIEAARAATTTIPILANDLESDPVASRYVESLSHPGGNLTGMFLDAPSLCGKWLQQIGDIVPNVTRVAATTGTYQLDAMTAAAKGRSIDLVVMEFRDNPELETALQSGLAHGPQAVIQLGSPLARQAGARIAEILSARRIPGISQFRTFSDGGGQPSLAQVSASPSVFGVMPSRAWIISTAGRRPAIWSS